MLPQSRRCQGAAVKSSQIRITQFSLPCPVIQFVRMGGWVGLGGGDIMGDFGLGYEIEMGTAERHQVCSSSFSLFNIHSYLSVNLNLIYLCLSLVSTYPISRLEAVAQREV